MSNTNIFPVLVIVLEIKTNQRIFDVTKYLETSG